MLEKKQELLARDVDSDNIEVFYIQETRIKKHLTELDILKNNLIIRFFRRSFN